MISGPKCVAEINTLLTNNKITFELSSTTLESTSRIGLMKNYGINSTKSVRAQMIAPLTMPVGAGNVRHFDELIEALSTSGAVAGSMFVFKKSYRALLISYKCPKTTGEPL